jgi:hypothetical protein
MTFLRTSASLLVSAMIAAISPTLAAAQVADFSDVPSDHPAYEAIMALKEVGILSGYADGTFKPEQKVNRAEAIKIIVSPLVPAAELSTYTAGVYSDVPADAWYKTYVEAARQRLGIIDGPPKAAAFNGTRAVNKAEFLKIMQLANKETPLESYSEFRAALSSDVANPDEWFYPYMRLGLATSMVMLSQEGTLAPSAELTRADVAQMMYFYLMYKQGRRTQALLSEAESEILNVLQLLEMKDIQQADYASARSFMAARGALTSMPDEALVKGAVKVSEGFRTIVFAYYAGVNGQLQEAIQLSSDAWHLAEKAREFSSSLNELAVQMQTIAKSIADEARVAGAQ